MRGLEGGKNLYGCRLG